MSAPVHISSSLRRTLHRSGHNPALTGGRVILAAAGPGDPDLITIKAVDALQQAEVVLTDRLVSPLILERYVPASAQIIYVGKACSIQKSTPQATINSLMVKYATQGKYVVRLKGGDVSIFSNILDELQVLKANNIPYQIIPGITAALGAAAYAGMPLTARDHATAVRFLTYYSSHILTEDYWKELAASQDTLVFYMSMATITAVVENLTRHGISANVGIAVIEQATTCFQQVHTCNIYQYAQTLGHKEFASPSLLIIGKVVSLHKEYSWLQNGMQNQNYFQSLEAEQEIHINKPVKNVI